MNFRTACALAIAVILLAFGCQEGFAQPSQRQALGELHILAHKPIDSLAQLDGRRIAIATGGKITKNVMLHIVQALGIRPEKIYMTEPTRAIISVLNDDVDAVLFVGKKSVLYFKNMEKLAAIKTGANAGKLDQVHLLSIDNRPLPEGLVPAVLTHNDYNYIGENVHTLEVMAPFVVASGSTKQK